jgi:hypothetical protein
MRTFAGGARAACVAVLAVTSAAATLVPQLSFEQLTDSAEMILSGKITDSWTAWDQSHKYIWTHYHLQVDTILKGSPAAVIEFAEPGGSIGTDSMIVGASPMYAAGENAVIFLSRMPNGYLRTTGWTQGKWTLDDRGRVQGPAIRDSVTLRDLARMVAARSKKETR